jgi:hypothetical protein
MIQDYEECRRKFLDVQKRFDEALDKQADMIEQHKVDVNIVAEVERLRTLLNDRKALLDVKERELRKSKDKTVIIFVAKEIDGKNVDQIAMDLNYSRSQVFRILQSLKSEKDATKCDRYATPNA